MKIISSESVFKGHPDKVCDQISDAILDAILAQDRKARVAVETAIKDDLIVIFGEVTTTAVVSYSKIAKEVMKQIGYQEIYRVLENISVQSPDIALGVDKEDQGAGDQGMMYGFACDESENLMPIPIHLAHEISKRIDSLRELRYGDLLGPDGKCQVSVVYDDFDRPIKVDTIVISTQTKPDACIGLVKRVLYKEVLEPILGINIMETNVLINPTGKFEIGGSFADAGLTGRKIIVDTYGGYSKHGGGAFSGKDSSKVDRSAAYYARYVAKAVVAADLAGKCEIGVSYSIGIADPVSISLDTFGTGIIPDSEILTLVKKVFNFKPANIRKELKLNEGLFKYQSLASYGHMGRNDLNIPWEQVDGKVQELERAYEEAEGNT
ncbi:methionine adenosyltransferase [Liberiplasma polymorphum]|uniref:methionine adenosyltransferase n=1 Tax=Liberiplasma polymorphum TaxID=3374570 RepID=UPI0037765748